MQEIAIAIIGSGAFSALISALISFVNAKQKAKKGSDELIMFLAAAMLNNLAIQYISKNGVTEEELKLFIDMHKKYKDKGGNGYIDVLRKKVESLPIIVD